MQEILPCHDMAFGDVPAPVREAVLLCGDYHHRAFFPQAGAPPSMLPLLGVPLLYHVLHALVTDGVREIIIVAGMDCDGLDSAVAPWISRDVRVTVRREQTFKGTAGDLKGLEDDLSLGCFFVVRGDLFVQAADLASLRHAHLLRSGVATFAGRRDGAPLGAYLFEPDVLRFISPAFMDIDDDLLPTLREQGLAVASCVLPEGPLGPCVMEGFGHFLKTERRLLQALADVESGRRIEPGLRGYQRMAGGIWIGKGVRISPEARLKGPLLIGDRTVIEEQAEVVGPSVIGSDCRIERRAVVEESSVWDEGVIVRASRVIRSLVGCKGRTPAGSTLVHSLVMGGPIGLDTISAVDAPADGVSQPLRLSLALGPGERRRYRTHGMVKRAIDLLAAAAGLTLSLPVFCLIALAIKLDSHGPVLFRQRRCGRYGREFPMLKFRTMVVGAERRQASLRRSNDVEGPVFKLFNDPRVTRLGRFLRETSLDELPQLLNVLRGDMSLVGPRPLAREELKGCSLWREGRLLVQPGITGLWQVNARNCAGFSRWVAYDLEYVARQSLREDLRLLAATVSLVARAFVGPRPLAEANERNGMEITGKVPDSP